MRISKINVRNWNGSASIYFTCFLLRNRSDDNPFSVDRVKVLSWRNTQRSVDHDFLTVLIGDRTTGAHDRYFERILRGLKNR